MSYAAVLDMDSAITGGTERYDAWISFPLGAWHVTATKKGLVSITLTDRLPVGVSPLGQAAEAASVPVEITGWLEELQRYLSGALVDIARIPIDYAALEATDFQKRVWLSLLNIPYGETRDYRWLASSVGVPKAARAVGQANGANPLPLVIPCHRVVAATGKIGGYMRKEPKGKTIKRWLLDLEQLGL